jgi:hypothetical protein
MWFIYDPPFRSTRHFPHHVVTPLRMSSNSKEVSILLAIKAIHSDPKINITCASKMYSVPRSTLRDQIA